MKKAKIKILYAEDDEIRADLVKFSLEKEDFESFFDNVFYIDFKTEKARSALEEFVNKHEVYLGADDTFPFDFVDFYYWDRQRERWCSLSALKGLVASMEEIRNSP
jgi:hypothetical protein